MKRFIFRLYIFSITFCLFFHSCEKELNSIDHEEESIDIVFNYDLLGLGELPVGLWVTPPAQYQTYEEYAKIRECGMNFVNGFHYYENNYNAIMRILDFCEQNNLKYFTNKSIVEEDIIKYSKNADRSLLTKFINGIKPYAEHSAFAGELLLDEPGKNLFEAISAYTKAFDDAYPEKMWHVNLYPSYATGGIRTSSYDDYISSWLLTVPSKHISYDSYPLLATGGIIDDYFYNLDILRAKSRYRKIPFWSFIQTLPISAAPGTPEKRVPSEIDIRWQIWSNLAFGVKGIQYFCYWTPNNALGDALVDRNGKKTERYYYAKKINKDVNSIGKILLNCHAEGVILTSPFKEYKMYDQLYHFGIIESVSGESIVGCFENNKGKKKILITSLVPEKRSNVTLNFSQDSSKLRIWRNNTSEEKVISESKISFLIEEGEAIFIEFI